MSMKLTFQDEKGNTLHAKDLICGKSARLPKQGDRVQFSDGPPATVESRKFVYGASKRGKADMQVIFVCKKVAKPTGGNVRTTPTKGVSKNRAPNATAVSQSVSLGRPDLGDGGHGDRERVS
jgi:hypothetical protein